MTRPEAPQIGSRIRITAKWASGLKTITEGTYTGWCEPDWELDGWHRVPFSGAGHSCLGVECELPEVTVEILSLPEPADGTWVTTPNRDADKPPYVFHRDDSVLRYASSPEYRWWFHEDGDWISWAEVQQRGEFTVIKDGAK